MPVEVWWMLKVGGRVNPDDGRVAALGGIVLVRGSVYVASVC